MIGFPRESGFRGYEMLMSERLYAIFWIGRFNPRGEKWNSTQLTRNTIIGNLLWHFNWAVIHPQFRRVVAQA